MAVTGNLPIFTANQPKVNAKSPLSNITARISPRDNKRSIKTRQNMSKVDPNITRNGRLLVKRQPIFDWILDFRTNSWFSTENRRTNHTQRQIACGLTANDVMIYYVIIDSANNVLIYYIYYVPHFSYRLDRISGLLIIMSLSLLIITLDIIIIYIYY